MNDEARMTKSEENPKHAVRLHREPASSFVIPRRMKPAGSKLILFAVLIGCAILSHVLSGGAEPQIPALNPYYYDILIGIGINIILATSLNLVNGYTGQFSLGHAGFMAVGAYAASWLTLTYGYAMGVGKISTTAAFVLALIGGRSSLPSRCRWPCSARSR